MSLRSSLLVLCFFLVSAFTASVFQTAWFLRQQPPVESSASLKYLNILHRIRPLNVQKPWLGAAAFYSAVELLGLFLENMNPSFDHASDWLPSGRKKLIHSQGVIASVSWIPLPSTSGTPFPYTGLFETGADQGLIRASFAVAPSRDDKTGKVSITPGIALKFFRDKLPSTNTIAMVSLNGQDKFNFFYYWMSNHVSDPEGLIFKALAKKFHTASEHETKLGLSDMARHHVNGTTVRNPVFPYRLTFKPTRNVARCIQQHLVDETGLDTWYLQLTGTSERQCIPKDTILFDVWAMRTPSDNISGGGSDHIAQLQIKMSEFGNEKSVDGFFSSEVADRQLFFQHVRMEEDYKFRPEWKF